MKTFSSFLTLGNFKIGFLTILLWGVSSKSTAHEFVFSETCQDAYEYFLSMKIEAGKAQLHKEIVQNKYNLIPYILINYEDYITLSFNEDPKLYKQKKPLLEKRLAILEAGPKDSPYYLFLKGLLRFQWCIIQVKHGDYWDATWNFRKAFLLFKQNKQKYPGFQPNNIFIGTQEAILSTIPQGYKWVSTILGLDGNMTSGMKVIKSYINSKNPLFKEEASFYYIYLKNYLENDPKGASIVIKELKLDLVNNQLFAFMASNLALNNKNAALSESILSNRTRGKEYSPFPMLDYELGSAKLRRLDFSSSNYFLKYLASYKGHFYVKDAYYHLAISAYLQDDLKQANYYLNQLKKNGKSESDADKQAQKFALKGVFPNKELIKARLLNDGGNNLEALNVLNAIDKKKPLTLSERIEFYYRFGRIYDDLNQKVNALVNYKRTIELGRYETEYFAAKAALQSAYLFEEQHKLTEAISYFNLALDMDNHEYKNSIDQRAKAGLNRVKGK